jgi:glycosyltransferase involved in cell wall biosynthesis
MRWHPATRDERSEARRALSVSETAVVALYVGRLAPEKQIDLILRAWKISSTRERSLLVVGDGPLRAPLEHLARTLALSGVRFDGYSLNILQYLHAADFVVLSSINEGLPMSLLEAAAAGLPLLATDIPANREIVKDGSNGLLFRQQDVDSLAAQFNRLLQSDNLRSSMGSKSRRVAKEAYALEDVVREHITLYENVIIGRHAHSDTCE